jgi:hypothetical protein
MIAETTSPATLNEAALTNLTWLRRTRRAHLIT